MCSIDFLIVKSYVLAIYLFGVGNSKSKQNNNKEKQVNNVFHRL